MKRDMGSAKKSLALAMTGALAFASMAGCGTAGSGPSAAALSGALESSIRSAMRRQGIVGMSAVVVSGGRRVLAAGYGFADRSRKIPVTVDTVFPIASITKLFTATAVMQLVERGAVDLDSPVSRYLPQMAGPGGPDDAPTVRQLLTHHAGIQGNIMEGFELKEPDPTAFRDVPRLVASLPRTSAPDTVFAYCNAGFSVLGCLVEAAGGTGYTDAVERGILEPLGMSRTRFFTAPADVEDAVIGYEGRRPVPVYPMRDIPAGALLSTAADMERFMGFVFDRGRDGVLGRAAFDEMTRRQNAHVPLDGDFSDRSRVLADRAVRRRRRLREPRRRHPALPRGARDDPRTPDRHLPRRELLARSPGAHPARRGSRPRGVRRADGEGDRRSAARAEGPARP